MPGQVSRLGWLCLTTMTLWIARAGAQAVPTLQVPSIEGLLPRATGGKMLRPGTALAPSLVDLQAAISRVPFAKLSPAVQERVRPVLEQPTLFARGPMELFAGSEELYAWLLDHPDLGARAWQRLGAKSLEIACKGAEGFAWTDGQGSEVRWVTVHAETGSRIWLAEGKYKPGPLLGAVPVRAVVVLRHGTGSDGAGRPMLWHQADIFFQTDSATAALVARLLGPAAPRLAEQYLGQMEIFFSALTWYASRHPERLEFLGLQGAPQPVKSEE